MKTNMHTTCPICSDLYDEDSSIVAAPCGHVFHEKCLLEWVNQSETCPDCHIQVTEEKVVKLYCNTVPRNDSFDNTAAENEINDLKAQLNAKDEEVKKWQSEKEQIEVYLENSRGEMEYLKEKRRRCEYKISYLSFKLKSLPKLKAKFRKLERKNAALTHDFSKVSRSLKHSKVSRSLKHSARLAAKNHAPRLDRGFIIETPYDLLRKPVPILIPASYFI